MIYERFYIEITNTCNLNCSFCLPTQRKPSFMSIEDFKHILDEINPYSKHIYLHLKGEPTLHPQLKEIMDLSSLYEKKVHLVTNGTLLDKLNFDLIDHPALAQLTLSLHSLQELDESSREETLKSIESIIMRSKDKHFSLFLRIWNENNSDLLDWLRKILDTDFEYQANKHRLFIRKNLTLDFDKEFTWPSLKAPYNGDIGTCYGGTKMMAILVDGQVSPCCLDNDGDMSLGNVLTSPFKALINHSRYLDFMSGMASNRLNEPLCQHCTYHLKHKKRL
jgi:radical SAM protein with 4Fe4S-binding SPASM domain